MPFTFNPFTGKLDFYEASSGGTVTSVSGTANRITVTNPTTTPVIDIAATYVGQSSITTLGTITTGTWNGTAIGPTFGGTGQTTYTTGDILYASAANTLSKLAVGSSTQVLTVSGGVPSWQAAGGGSSTYFQAYRTTNQTVAGGNTTTTIVFDTAIDNVGSAYDVSTGIFTAPATGYYAFSTTVFFNNLTTPAGLSQIILAYTGSVQSLRLQNTGLVPATTGAALIVTASWFMPMTSGDTVKIQPFADGAGNYTIAGAALSSGSFTTSSTFSGFRVA